MYIYFFESLCRALSYIILSLLQDENSRKLLSLIMDRFADEAGRFDFEDVANIFAEA